jgi:hypothetical protein
VSRRSGGKHSPTRQYRYVCANYWNRGASVCPNGRMASMAIADEAIRDVLGREVLQPSVIERALDRAVAALQAQDCAESRTARRQALDTRLAAVTPELANLAEMAARCG